MHSNKVCEKVILMKGDFLFDLEKKTFHFPTIDGAVLKQISENMQTREKLSFCSSFPSYWHFRGCIVMLTFVDNSLLVKFYYPSQESTAEALLRFRTEKEMKKGQVL